MKNSTAWIFGLVVIVVFLYFAWNGFEVKSILIGKKEYTYGKVVDIFIGYGIKGKIVTRVDYVYEINSKFYEGIKTVTPNLNVPDLGDLVKIKYSIINPNNHNFIGFYRKNLDQELEKFEGKVQSGYAQIKLRGNIFNRIEFFTNKEVKRKIFGEYIECNDTIYIKLYILTENQLELKDLVYFRLKDKSELIDLKTNEIYYMIK